MNKPYQKEERTYPGADVACYGRVSTVKTEQSHALKGQVDRLRVGTLSKGWKPHIYIEKRTGKEPTLKNRKILRWVLTQLDDSNPNNTHHFKGLVVTDLSRLSRNTITGGQIIDTIINSQKFLYVISYNGFYDSTNKKMELTLLKSFFTHAEAESSAISDRAETSWQGRKVRHLYRHFQNGIEIPEMDIEEVKRLRSLGITWKDIANKFKRTSDGMQRAYRAYKKENPIVKSKPAPLPRRNEFIESDIPMESIVTKSRVFHSIKRPVPDSPPPIKPDTSAATFDIGEDEDDGEVEDDEEEAVESDEDY